MALDNGNYSIQPNNRILWNISNFTTRDDIPDYKHQTMVWNVENNRLDYRGYGQNVLQNRRQIIYNTWL